MGDIEFSKDGRTAVVITDDQGDCVRVSWDLIQQFVFEQSEITEKLKDPNSVHINMLQGAIAKISMEQCAHVHGADMVEKWNKFKSEARGDG